MWQRNIESEKKYFSDTVSLQTVVTAADSVQWSTDTKRECSPSVSSVGAFLSEPDWVE